MSVRVLHVLPHRGGGAETYIDYLERMPGVLHERHYLSSGRAPVHAAVSIPVGWPALRGAARTADLLHTHGDMASIATQSLLRGRPTVITSHGLHFLRRSDGWRLWLVRRGLRATASAAQAFICCSVAERDELLPILSEADHPKLHVIHNGVDLPDPIPASERTAARQSFDISPEAFVAVFAGHLEPRKAPLVAARAAICAGQRGVPVVLLLAGDGPQAGELAGLTSPIVRPLGHRTDLRPLWAAGDVFLQPAEREGLSFAVLEAMAHGLPVLAADAPGNAEAVGDAGILFPPRDEAAAADALASLSAQPALREAFSTRARARVEAELGASRFVERTHALYLAALGRVTELDRAGADDSA